MDTVASEQKLGPTTCLTPFRQGMELAEGQNSADVKHILTPPPPSAKYEKWREGSNSSRKSHNFHENQRRLAEGIRKNLEEFREMPLTVATGA